MRGMAQGSWPQLFRVQLKVSNPICIMLYCTVVQTVARLFIIMGLPWLADLASAWQSHGAPHRSHAARLALDTLNLLTVSSVEFSQE